MRHKIVPESIGEALALWAGKVPLPVVDALFPLVKARSLMAAEQLGVFEALRQEPQSPAGLARRLRLDEESLGLLLRVLAASGYLEHRQGAYRLSPVARKTLVHGGRLDSRGFLRFNYAQWRFLECLEDLLRTGCGLDLHASMQDAGEWESYQRAMMEIARMHAPILARHLPVRPGAALLLDLGGSHGVLGAALCRRHPPLRSRVLELPAALEPARRLAREEGIGDLVEHVGADLRTADLGSGADVVLLSNVLHHFSPEEGRDLVRKAWRALGPGGTIAIWDVDRPPEGAQPQMGTDVLALFFRLTSGSRCYSAGEFRGWLLEAGFAAPHTVRPPLAPLYALLHARKT
ncbi:MAG TPA: class I SAM-dependent methyltransferase [Myxococcales bacterium]|nr:class I SAM-dependent methyltransferase [Myxococcales bacterium]